METAVIMKYTSCYKQLHTVMIKNINFGQHCKAVQIIRYYDYFPYLNGNGLRLYWASI